MKSEGYALFTTPIGTCGIVWGERGINGVQLPEATEAATRARLLRHHAGAQEVQPPDEIQRVIEAIVALLRSEPSDFSGIMLDMSEVPEFHRSVYAITRAIPRGETLTYGTIAATLGDPGAARAVGQALGRNPFPIIIPCHRVLGVGGKLGGFSGSGGAVTKLRLLTIEGAQVHGELGLTL